MCSLWHLELRNSSCLLLGRKSWEDFMSLLRFWVQMGNSTCESWKEQGSGRGFVCGTALFMQQPFLPSFVLPHSAQWHCFARALERALIRIELCSVFSNNCKVVSDIWRSSLELSRDCETTKLNEKIYFFLLLSMSLVSVCDQTFPTFSKLQPLFNSCSWKAEILAHWPESLIQAARCTFKLFF